MRLGVGAGFHARPIEMAPYLVRTGLMTARNGVPVVVGVGFQLLADVPGRPFSPLSQRGAGGGFKKIEME